MKTRRPTRRAVTLAELIMVIGVAPLLFGVIASVLVIALHALPDKNDMGATAIDRRGRLAEFADEALGATAVSVASATEFAFTTQDRNSDGSLDAFSYSWSGTVGDPLVKRWPSGARQILFPAVRDCRFTYHRRTHSRVTEDDQTLSGEVELFDWSDNTALAVAVTSKDDHIGQSFRPMLPAGAQSWTLTRVKLHIAKTHTDAGLRLTVYETDSDGRPKGAALETAEIDGSELSWSYRWLDVTLSDVEDLLVGQRLAIVLASQGGNNRAGVRYHAWYDAAVTTPYGGRFLESDDAGATWTTQSDAALRMIVYGRYTTDTTELEETEHIHTVELTVYPVDALQVTTVEASLRNHPETP